MLSVFRFGGAGAVLGLLVGVANVLYQLSVTGSGFAPGILLDVATASRVAMVVCLLIAFVSAFFVLSPRLQGGALVVLTNCFACTAAVLLMISAGDWVRLSAFADLSERSVPLIEAVGAFEARFGHPPPDLCALVPEFAAALPRTGMSAYPRYEYVTGEAARRRFAARWALYIDTPNGPVTTDLLYYVPSEQYPEHGNHGLVERVGRWAYVYK